MPKRSLQTNFEINGIWWLPDKENNKVNGTLEYSISDGFTLKVTGNINKVFNQFGLTTFPIIHGKDSDGEKVTLFENYQISYKGGIIQENKFQIGFALVGEYLNLETNYDISFATINFNLLEEWFGHVPFSAKSTLHREHIKITAPKSKFNFKVKSIDSFLSCVFIPNLNHNSFTRLNAFYEANLMLKPIESNKIKWILDRTRELKYLFTLLVGKPVSFKNIYFVRKGKREYLELLIHDGFFFYKEDLRPFEMTAPFSDIKSDFRFIVNKWFDKIDRLKKICDLFFASQHKPEMFLEFNFISLAQALENYYRCFFKGTYISQNDYDKFCKSFNNFIPKYIPDDLKESLKSRLKYGNEYSFKNKIIDVLNKLDPVKIESIVGIKKKVALDIKKIRNYFTHYTESELSEEQLDKIENTPIVSDYIDRIEAILTAALLFEIGVSEKIIIKKLRSRYMRKKDSWKVL